MTQQPDLVRGAVDENGVYSNSFGRNAKPLHSDILIKNGLLSEIGQHDILPKQSLTAQNYLITDSVCDDLFADEVMISFAAAGVKVTKLVVQSVSDESNESSTEPVKTREVFNQLTDEILAKGITKHSCIISLGGGVVNNMCGLLAATLYRGIPLIHITTTTMGAFDAAIDFKQAVNHPLGKNLLGAYYPASKIVIDPEAFRPLSSRHSLNGIAEALKHGLAQSQQLVDVIVKPIVKQGKAVLRDPDYLTSVCRECVETKVPTLTWYDESDFNEMVPQYGHAIGHAIEHLSWHPAECDQDDMTTLAPLLHGEAVAVGMAISAEVSFLMGLCDEKCVAEHYSTLEAVGLPAYVPANMSIQAIIEKMGYDKHHVGVPSMGLCAAIGKMAKSSETSYCWKVDISTVEDALRRNIAKREELASPPETPSTLSMFDLDASREHIMAGGAMAGSAWYGCACSS
ncbi:hypothetical protein AB1Y20_011713 [Prymnesium parvum]|uniref:3-dehydroquinate synthase domain-containing protein n=1 Tax=Prymnesium parvum TaxID=97485 RepID=A0AB34II02_PRYPA